MPFLGHSHKSLDRVDTSAAHQDNGETFIVLVLFFFLVWELERFGGGQVSQRHVDATRKMPNFKMEGRTDVNNMDTTAFWVHLSRAEECIELVGGNVSVARSRGRQKAHGPQELRVGVVVIEAQRQEGTIATTETIGTTGSKIGHTKGGA